MDQGAAGGDVTGAPSAEKVGRARRSITVLLVVVATVALFTVGVAGQDPVIRWIALAVAGAAATPSLVLAKKRGDLAGWYVLTTGVMVLRLLTGK